MRDAETILADADQIGDDADYRDHVALDARSSRLLLEVALDQRDLLARFLALYQQDSAMESELSARVAAKEGARREALDALADTIVEELFTNGVKGAARSRIREELKTLEL